MTYPCNDLEIHNFFNRIGTFLQVQLIIVGFFYRIISKWRQGRIFVQL